MKQTETGDTVETIETDKPKQVDTQPPTVAHPPGMRIKTGLRSGGNQKGGTYYG